MKKKINILSFLFVILILSGCGSFEGVFSDSKLPPLKGERIPFMQMQQTLEANQALASQAIVIPRAWTNKFWPQSGGYPNHAMGQLALNEDLKQVWSADIGVGGHRRDPLITQPVAAEGKVFTIDTDGYVTAFNIRTGEEEWRVSSVAPGTEDSGALGGGLAYASGRLYVTNGYKQFVCLNPSTGKMIWRSVLPSPARASPTVADDKAYLITLDHRLRVFSAVDGMPLWEYAGMAETTNLLGSVSPAVGRSIVILPMSSGEIIALRVENGQVVWADNLSAVRRYGSLSSISDIRGQPVLDQGVVYAASYSGRMVAIDSVSGERLWQREIGSAEMPWSAGPVVFVVTSGQKLMALTRQSGDIHWITQLPRFEDGDKEKPVVWVGPILAGGRLILASNTGKMLEVDPQDGTVFKKRDLLGEVMVPPLVADETLLLLTKKGKLVAYR